MAKILEKWLDYSAGKISGSAIKAAGYAGVIRYIDAPGNLGTKHTSVSEYRDHLAHGLKVRLVMEVSTSDADGGYARGVSYAQRAKAGADLLGYRGVIFFCNDRTSLPAPAVWQAYLDGAASVLGKARVGAYGFKDALNAARGHASAFWQAGRESDLVGHANYYQWNNGNTKVGGITCDINYVYSFDSAAPAPVDSTDSNARRRKAEHAMFVPASTDDFVTIPVLGGTKLYVSTAYGRSVVAKEIWFVGDSPAKGGNYLNNGAGLTFAADRPGPVPVASGAKSVTLRYSADHAFSAWVE